MFVAKDIKPVQESYDGNESEQSYGLFIIFTTHIQLQVLGILLIVINLERCWKSRNYFKRLVYFLPQVEQNNNNSNSLL